jgi:hypothetical protein
MKRKRGGQPGNVNALKHGGRTRAALALERELSTLMAEARCAMRIAKSLIPKGKRGRKSKNPANE